MRVLICDDEQKMIDLEVSMLQKYCQSANVIATFYAFTDSLSAENTDEFDIAFLDIDMAELNGIDSKITIEKSNGCYHFCYKFYPICS